MKNKLTYSASVINKLTLGYGVAFIIPLWFGHSIIEVKLALSGFAFLLAIHVYLLRVILRGKL